MKITACILKPDSITPGNWKPETNYKVYNVATVPFNGRPGQFYLLFDGNGAWRYFSGDEVSVSGLESIYEQPAVEPASMSGLIQPAGRMQ